MSLMKRIVLILLVLLAAFSLSAATTKGSMSALEAVDYYGNTVTAELFKPYDVTMVNIFTTWCTYCLREIPDIRQIRKDLPENANVIAICADAFEAPSDLKDIMEFFSIDYTVLKMKTEEVKKFYSVLGYPTTLFVGSNGDILDVQVGLPKLGAYLGYTSKINKILEQLQ